VAQNIISGKMPVVYWQDVKNADPQKTILLDVRTQDEYSLNTLTASINIPLDDLRDRLTEIPTDKTIYVFCAIGLRGYLATNILLQRGYKNVFNVSGGYKTYDAATAPIVNQLGLGETEKRPQEMDLDIQTPKPTKKFLKIDACGLQCPGPIMKLKNTMDGLEAGDRIEVTATDAGFSRDSQAWSNITGNRVISQSSEAGRYTVVIEKMDKAQAPDSGQGASNAVGKGKTMIMFSDDLDKALATFVLANGAAATGEKVSIFFTFWGLNVIKKAKKPSVTKDFFGKMFSMMLPSHSGKLSLSKLNMMGTGSKIMKHIMKLRGIDSLESLRQQALDNGVEFIACQMSMDMMGVKREELMDEVSIGGVAAYMERANEANINLFI
jgi:peroxiredoxin family protein/rhodanese-related sulfurtransferase/TusA-related sulfurtransferase